MEEFVKSLQKLEISTSGLGPRNLIEFNPINETTALLNQWLLYRGVRVASLKDVNELSIEEIVRPGKPFNGFVNFDPKDASLVFLKSWLSYFGIGGDSVDKNWWIKKTQQILNLLKSLSKIETLTQKFKRWINLRKQLRKRDKNIELLNLQLKRLIELKIQTQPMVNNNQPTLQQKNEWFLKNLLAKSMDASAVFVPLLFYQIQKKKKIKKKPNIENGNKR